VLAHREDRHRLLEPGANFLHAAGRAAEGAVIDERIGREAGLPEIPVLAVDADGVARQQVVDLDAIGELLERERHARLLRARSIGVVYAAWIT
jgi:hypothetical protein